MSPDPTPVMETEPETVLEGDTYEIIRRRLQTGADTLRTRLDKLNQARKDIFGAIEPTLLATERITTANNCIPRDMVSLGEGKFIFGYNVHMGLKSEIKLTDVFAVYTYQGRAFTERPPDILQTPQFEDDFKALYKYYKDTQFTKFSIIGPYLFMVFRIGKAVDDIKTFKWVLKDGELTYVDNRSDHEFRFPAQHDFSWKRTTRDAHRAGACPHVSIEDRLFVEAVGGDITFKVEDNTETGQGIYAEPVENTDQTLDDAEIWYSIVGHMLVIKIKPYQEKAFRYFIFNEKVQEVCRVDAIASACVLLPDSQGLIFSNGYYLQTGELKQFESGLDDMIFESRIAAANGEDFLYSFYQQESGDYILLPYNLIEQKVDNPITCNGFTHFPNGEMLFFRSSDEPARHHVIQIWQTPFTEAEAAISEKKDAFLYKIGNPDIVRCMAECHELLKIIGREAVHVGLYIDLVKNATDISDAYFWLDRKETFNIKEVLLDIKNAAASAVDAFEKVLRLKKSAAAEVFRVSKEAGVLLGNLAPERMDRIETFVGSLSHLRTLRGDIISLKEMRYMDVGSLEALEQEISGATENLSERCVDFLLTPDALSHYEEQISQIRKDIEKLDRETEARALQQKTDNLAGELEMLIDIVSNLKIEDATQTTRIIDSISEVYASLNQLKAGIRNAIKRLRSIEGDAQFNAQLKLLNQSVVNYLDICDTPEKCDEYLNKTMVQIEELEGRFADFDDFLIQLTEKRDSLYNAFETRKLNLVEERNRKADTLQRSADRILKGIAARVAAYSDINAINGYFAADLMIEKIRNTVTQLVQLGDTVKADDILARLKTIREDTVRQLKDRQELYGEGEHVIRFGNHQFSVNRQPLDLSIVRRGDRQFFHLAGTNFFELITDDAFEKTRPVWDMTLPSENAQIYRAEYLAFKLLRHIEEADATDRDAFISLLAAEAPDALVNYVQQFMGPRYAEGYQKGLHDRDGAAIVKALADIHFSIGLLRFHPRARALARLFWMHYDNNENRRLLISKLTGFGLLRHLFPDQVRQTAYIEELAVLMSEFIEQHDFFSHTDIQAAAQYLFYELSGREQPEEGRFVVSRTAYELIGAFQDHLKNKNYSRKFNTAREKMADASMSEYQLLLDWLGGYNAAYGSGDTRDYLEEAAAILLAAGRDPVHHSHLLQKREAVETPLIDELEGMTGDHAVIQDGKYQLNYLRFMEKMIRFETHTAPLFDTYQSLKKSLTDCMRSEMRLENFKPRILSSFVRNRLINKVYLPLIGDNLAKQIGTAGENKRTDLMGMLLLISPPGYGKTTLMEYLANRLGIIFIKINGPAIGYKVTSLDPAEATNAAAREEMQKLNLAFEMGDNVMIYLDDIQHCNPELLQKFISLCDAQRKIEGVYKGRSRTYDFRGKKVVVVMAGNPYTESGEKFQIPDMLANRADTYNLGDIIGDSADDFTMSYLENALTSNPVLNKMASRHQEDIYAVIHIAATGDREGVKFLGAYSVEEVDEMVSVMQKMMAVRDVILKVNQAYIYSAAQSDDDRTEPPFKLQGSYRNMNRICEKIVPIMNEQELSTLILSHYVNEAQTLTSGTEANLLKFKSLTNMMDAAESRRWEAILKTYRKKQLFMGADAADPVNRVVMQLSAFQEGLDAIRGVLAAGIDTLSQADGRRETTAAEPRNVSISDDTLSKLHRVLTHVASERLNDKKTESPGLPPKMKVVTELPKSMQAILEKHFQMMHTWMEPTLNETLRQSQDMEKIIKALNELKSAYKGVIREKGDFDEAIVYYSKAIEVDRYDHLSYYNRGVAWYNKKDIERALSDAKNALSLNPKSKKYQSFVNFLEAEDVEQNPL